jgi:hypothetical protein
LTGLTVVKKFTYRGNSNEEFSNQYWFKGPPPGDDPSWTVLMNDVLAQEEPIYPNTVTFVRAYGYNDDSSTANHVFVHDWVAAGTPPKGSYIHTGTALAGDQAGLVVWKTDQLNTRGKPIFLRKYIHAGDMDAGSPDNIASGWFTRLEAYGNGIRPLHGGLTNPSSEHHPGGSESVIGVGVSPYVTTRTLKRRGKRPKTGS